MKLHPLRALHPAPGRAADVASPPYDVVDTAEARALAAGNDASFLHVVRPEIDLPAGTSLYDASVYAQGAVNLARFRADGLLVQDDQDALWVYRLDMGEQRQIGVVGCAEVDDYRSGRIKKHEHTRPAKEDDRTRHVDTMGAQAGPVFLTCRDEGALAELVARLSAGAPDVDVTATGGVRHQLWRVADADGLAALADAFAAVDAFYIADGHHRAASAARVRDLRRERDGSAGAAERFLVVVFPSQQLEILAYNRVVVDLAGASPEGFLAKVGERFEIGEPGEAVAPAERHTFGLYLAAEGAWRPLRARAAIVDEADPIARLDVAILQDHLLGPILGIGDPRTDDRIAFVGGIRGLGELERRAAAAGGGGVAFAMYPTGIDELLDVADAGLVMPPKSTWFEPKLASGLLVHPLD